MLFWSLRGVIETTATVSPDAWLRHLDLLLAALAPAASRSQHPPLTAEQVEQVEGGGRPAGHAATRGRGPAG